MANEPNTTPTGVVQFPISATFAGSGVYLLHLRGQIVYVGQGKSMRARIGNHFSEGTKTFDGVSCIPCDCKRMDKIEKALIAAFAPKYNQCSVAKSVKRGNASAPISLHAAEYGLDRFEAAQLLGITPEALRALGDDGPAKRTGRKPRSRSTYTSYPVIELAKYMAA